ncbi:MAG: O-acetyl-ADP-ribose deacetylase [Fimbriimonadaceae bacterium]|jgi:O-acetyl-ADP-ribose deacetylase (regulator of RNase III)|nr:O-acetyl-ADP-ribose deacetylase [Fimbriimonadaceae bacterium]
MTSSVTGRIEIIRGDITQQRVDAIVNASIPSLLPGTGVCQAIHRIAGHRLAFECAKLGGCQRGEAKITHGFRLPAPYVIHTVGPVWNGGRENEAHILASAYANCLKLASQHALRTLAFPSISTGVYQYPVDKASRIAIKTISEYLAKEPNISKVVIVCFSEDVEAEYKAALAEIAPGHQAVQNSLV